MPTNIRQWKDDAERFVVFLDIMGFTERVNRTPVLALKSQLLDFKSKNTRLQPLFNAGDPTRSPYLKMAQFSDSIILISDGQTKDDLNKIVKATVVLIQTALSAGFALRGALALGNMVADDSNGLFFGRALVDAYHLEEELSYYGVVVHDSAEVRIKNILDANAHVSRPVYFPIEDMKVPLKSGKSSHFHIAWYKMDKYLAKGDISQEAKEWITALRATVSGKPRIYLDNTIAVIDESTKVTI